jgi:hypothetical protein
MAPFRQLILPGDRGSDVTAVKRAMRRMKVPGSEAVKGGQAAGPPFVAALRSAQEGAGLSVDGKYGEESHRLISPHFSKVDERLYLEAAIRPRIAGPAPSAGAVTAAKRLLKFETEGKYHADNSGDLADIRATAEGRPVHSQSGQFVHIDERVMRVLLFLIRKGHTIGTFAICSDHHDDGPHGHAGGMAVDISTIDGHALALASAREQALTVDRELHRAGALVPRQLITGGVGGARDAEISALSIPAADSFFGSGTMQDHCNHIHVGY